MRWITLAIVLLASPVAATPKAEDVAAYQALTALDARVGTIGYRLAAANTPFCAMKAPNPGWVLHGIGQYEDAETARAAFGFKLGSISIAALVPGGPAAKAGLLVGDDLIDLPGSRWDQRMHVLPSPTKDEAELVRKAMVDMWRPNPMVSMTFGNAVREKKLNFAPPVICASDFWVDTKTKVDAGADGERVRLTSAMVEFVANDDELAAVIAHELAHNLLGHRARLDGVKRGKTRSIRATEVEADQLSVWLMVNAGYDPIAALQFNERYGRKYALGIFSDGTHLRWKKRVEILQSEIDLINITEAKEGLRDPPLLMAFRNQQ
jgi:hypothetical protein